MSEDPYSTKLVKDINLELWKEWAQHWRFANQTEFRISEHLDTVFGAWGQVSGFLQSLPDPAVVEPIHFVRHALLLDTQMPDKTPIYESGQIAPIAQFTQSALFARLLAATDDDEKVKVSVQHLQKNVEAFAEWLKEETDRSKLWNSLIEAVEDKSKGYINEEIAFDRLRDLATETKIDPVLIGSLFLTFSHISHVGFLPAHLNQVHFDLKEKEKERNQVIGYVLTTEKGKNLLQDIKILRRVEIGGAVNEITKDEPQPVATWLDSPTLDSDELTKLFFNLWHVLNKPNAAKIFKNPEFASEPEIGNDLIVPGDDDPIQHNVVIPVYEWSEAPKECSSAKITRCRAGAMLGWAFHRIPKMSDKRWKSLLEELESKEGSSSLYQHIRSLCFMMEDFAVHYLDGQTEWALQRPWRRDDTPESFLRWNFYHSCGWECVEVTPILNDEPYYFQWKEVAHFLRADPELKSIFNSDNVPHENPDHLLAVNLTRHLPTRNGIARKLSKIAYFRPNSLCLVPEDSQALNAYLQTVAEKVRQFYARCVAIAEQRKKAELTGRVNEKESAFMAASHELKKLACIIPLANGKPHILNDLPNVFLMFSLPTAGKLNENDAHYLPDSLHAGSLTTYQDWLLSLIKLAASIEAISRPIISGVVLDESAYRRACNMFADKFKIAGDHWDLPSPEHFAVRCLFGTGLLCLLRNVLQHAFSEYDNIASDSPWSETYEEKAIITMENRFLCINNPICRKLTSGNGGTNAAAHYYFNQIPELDGWGIELDSFTNAESGNRFVCQVPLPFHQT